MSRVRVMVFHFLGPRFEQAAALGLDVRPAASVRLQIDAGDAAELSADSIARALVAEARVNMARVYGWDHVDPIRLGGWTEAVVL